MFDSLAPAPDLEDEDGALPLLWGVRSIVAHKGGRKSCLGRFLPTAQVPKGDGTL